MVFSIKIAILHHALGRFGGAEKLVILHAMHLKKMGFKVALYYGGPVLQDWRKKIQSHLGLKELPSGLPTSLSGLKRIFKLIHSLKSFDLVLIHHHICPFLAFYLSLFLRSRMIWYCGEPLRSLWEDWISGTCAKELRSSVVHTSETIYGKPMTSVFLSKTLYDLSLHILRSIDKATARRYQTIITNSYYTRDVVNTLYGFNKAMHVVYPGVDQHEHNHVQDPQNFEIKETANDFILNVGALTPLKNHITILKAFKKLPHKYDKDLNIVIIGHGPLKEIITSQAKEMGLPNLSIQGNINEQELVNYYRRCSFVVQLSLFEPFGLVPIEAALHGKPSIVSNLGGTKEIIVHSKSGLLVNPLNVNEVMHAIKKLIDDEQLRQKMGEHAKKRVLHQFNIEHSSKNLATILTKFNRVDQQ